MKKGMAYVAIAIAVLLAAYAVWIYPGKQVRPVGQLAFAESHDTQIAYYTSGEGQAVVLLASLGRSVSDFNALVPVLNRAGYRTISVESRGVGQSQLGDLTEPSLYRLADDIEVVLTIELDDGSTSVRLIGHAFGNRVARAYAHTHPQRVDAIALLASGGAQRLTDMPEVLAALRGCFKWWTPPPVRRSDVRFAFFAGSNPVPGDWMKGWHINASRAQAAAVANTPEKEWREAGGRAPILVLQGADDRIAPARLTSEKLRALFPDRVAIHQIEDAGHALLPEAPEEIAAVLIAFLRTHTDNEKKISEESEP